MAREISLDLQDRARRDDDTAGRVVKRLVEKDLRLSDALGDSRPGQGLIRLELQLRLALVALRRFRAGRDGEAAGSLARLIRECVRPFSPFGAMTAETVLVWLIDRQDFPTPAEEADNCNPRPQ